MINTDTLGLKVEMHSPKQLTIPPEVQIGLNPYLFAKPPTMGPNMNTDPLYIELAQEIVVTSEP